MKLLAGNSNHPLARAIASYLETELTEASVRRFADEEVFVEVHENVRGEDVFVIQSTSFPTNWETSTPSPRQYPSRHRQSRSTARMASSSM